MPELEARLRDLGESIEWPPTPELSGYRPGPVRRAPAAPRLRMAAAAAGIALLLVASAALAFPSARDAVLHWIGIGGVEVRRVPEPPRTAPADLGPAVSLAEAEARAGHPLVLLRGRGRPDAVHVRGGDPGPEVTLVYGGLRLTQVEAGNGPPVVGKVLGPETGAEAVAVDGHRGVWITGEPHGASAAGSPLRVAPDTLVWGRDGVLLRLEGAASRAEALRIAATVR